MARPLTAWIVNEVDRQFALGYIIAGLGWDAPALFASMVDDTLELVIGVLGRARSTVLVKGANTTLRAFGASNLL